MRRRPVAALLAGVAVIAVAGAGAGALLLGGRQPTPVSAAAAPKFVDWTAASGLDFTYGGGYTASLGGGVAVLDCDADARPDLFLAGGDGPSGLFRNEGTPATGPRFTAVDGAATRLDDVVGAYPLDIDADGNPDLAVLRVGGASLLRGLGGCRFEDAGAAWGFQPPDDWVTAFSATWEAGSTMPTLAFGSYVGLDVEGDATFTCPDNRLYRPAASAGGYDAPLRLAPGYCPLSMLFSDWDGSGRRDLRISNDRHYYDVANGQEQLWRVAPGEAPRAYGPEDGWVQMQIWGMGIASQDLTGDGLPEVYLTSQGDNKLQTLLEGPARATYRDIALRRGVIATVPVNGGDPLPSTAWHPEFVDVNADGFIDLYVSKGNIDRVEGYATRDPGNLFLGQPDGVFVEGAAEAGIVDFASTRGAALADFDGDGLVDLVEVKVNAPVMVWRNVGTGTAQVPVAQGSWLAVAPRQAGGNRDAIGAVIEVRVGEAVLRREVTVGGGHAGGRLGPAYFGLGAATRADVRVTWPDGEVGDWVTVEAGALVTIDRAAGVVSAP